MNGPFSPRVVLSGDHRGTALRQVLAEWCCDRGLAVEDVGPPPRSPSVDYPDEALSVAQAVAAGEADLGILVCGSGIGVSIAANKVAGVRAALIHDPLSAALARRHNDANVLCFGAGIIGPEMAVAALQAYLEASFEGGRHARRLEKIAALEQREPGREREGEEE
ncbi:MAG: ribose 5-phosphate isomerase B [Deltaproteobacteria bacterium]|nr:ribose 5-phosphate isomerase B [Deltaproteobacteria bacterium]